MVSYIKHVPLMILLYTATTRAQIPQSVGSNVDVTGSRNHHQGADSLSLLTVRPASCHTSTTRPESVSSIAHPSRIANSLATTLSGVPAAVPQSDSSFGIEPSAPAPGLHTRGSTDLSSHQRSATISPLRTSTYQPPPLAVTNVISKPYSDSDQLLDTFEQAVTSPGNAATSPKASPTSEMSAPKSAERPVNALDVLLSALPSDIASSIEAGYSVLTQELAATSRTDETRPPFNPTGISTSISQPTQQGSPPDERPESEYTTRPTLQPSDRSTSHRTSIPTADDTSRPTSPPLFRPTSTPPNPPTTRIPTTLSTITSSTATTSSSSTSSTTASNSTTNAEATQPTVSPAQQQSNGTIAGVATGAAAGVVLIILAIFFFLRRRQRKRAATPDPKQAFPEVAWLYDPPRSPPRSVSPPPQIGAIAGIGPARLPQRSSSSHAPEVVVPESEPLMAPGRAATRDNSPSGGGRGRSASPGGAVR